MADLDRRVIHGAVEIDDGPVRMDGPGVDKAKGFARLVVVDFHVGVVSAGFAQDFDAHVLLHGTQHVVDVFLPIKADGGGRRILRLSNHPQLIRFDG